MVTNITLDTLIVLDRKNTSIHYKLQNIYFGYDSAIIRSVSGRELDNLAQVLNDNPDITQIELGSHTDSNASDAYNLDLSQRRAQATVDYLIRKGIDPNRLVAKGYGESVPIAPNSMSDGSDNPEGRQKNRRTEFRILRIGPAVKKAEEFDEDKYFKDEKKDKNDN